MTMRFRLLPSLWGLWACLMLPACTYSRPGPLPDEFHDSAARSDIAIQPLRAPVALRQTNLPPAQDFEYMSEVRDGDLVIPGDVLSVTVIETPATALVPMLLPQPLQLPNLEVSPDGAVYIPYAGNVHAAGASLDRLRQSIARRLAGKLYQPQVSVIRTSRPRNTVAVYGAVTHGGPVALENGPISLGEVVGAAQPQIRNLPNARVRLTRNGQTRTIFLSELYEDPANDTLLQSGDVVTVFERSEFLTVIGAAGIPGRIEISGPRFSLIDAIASARGLSENFADPKSVFLLRMGGETEAGLALYELDMRDPISISAGAGTLVRDGDVIVAATSSFAQTRQMLGLVVQGLGLTANISRTVN